MQGFNSLRPGDVGREIFDGEYVEESEEATNDDDLFDVESASESDESEASSDEVEILDERNIDNLFSRLF